MQIKLPRFPNVQRKISETKKQPESSRNIK